MFGIGFSEVVIIFFVLILFVKPQHIPVVFRKIGHVYGQIKHYHYVFMNEIENAAESLRIEEEKKKD